MGKNVWTPDMGQEDVLRRLRNAAVSSAGRCTVGSQWDILLEFGTAEVNGEQRECLFAITPDSNGEKRPFWASWLLKAYTDKFGNPVLNKAVIRENGEFVLVNMDVDGFDRTLARGYLRATLFTTQMRTAKIRNWKNYNWIPDAQVETKCWVLENASDPETSIDLTDPEVKEELSKLFV